MDHRAVLFQREIDGSAHLQRVDTFSTQAIVEMDGHVASRLLLTPGARNLNLKIAKVDPHLLQDEHYIRRAAGGRRKEQCEHWAWPCHIITVHHDRRSTGFAAAEAETPLPGQCC